MVSEKAVVILLVVAIILSVISIAITLSVNMDSIKLPRAPKATTSQTGQVRLIVEKPVGGENEAG